ncbi:MAG: hypothetical protein QW086_01490 [Pyrobaculum sp.]
MLVGLQRRTAESVASGLSRIVPKMPYSHGNRKTGNIWSFDLPPILTCPYATFCGRPQRGNQPRQGAGEICGGPPLSLTSIRREIFGKTDLLELELAINQKTQNLPEAKTSEENHKLLRVRFETIAWHYYLHRRLTS